MRPHCLAFVCATGILLGAAGCSGGGASTEPITSMTLNDTGIVTAVDAQGRPVPCSHPDAVYQDCRFGRDQTDAAEHDGQAGFSFVKLSASGQALPASAADWACVLDRVTGLVWEAKRQDGGLHDVGRRFRWGGLTARPDEVAPGSAVFDDWDTLIHGSRAEALCGFRDWRVPSPMALRSIVHYAASPLSVDSTFFSTTQAGVYWTDTASVADPTLAHGIDFSDGAGHAVPRDSDRALRLVRGGGH